MVFPGRLCIYPYGLPGCLGHIFIMHISHYHKESCTNELIHLFDLKNMLHYGINAVAAL